MVSSCLSRTQPRLRSNQHRARLAHRARDARPGAPPGGRPRQAVPGASGTESFRSDVTILLVTCDIRHGQSSLPGRCAEPFAERPMVKHSWLPLLVAPLSLASVSLGCGSAARQQAAPQVTPGSPAHCGSGHRRRRRRCRHRPTRSSPSSTLHSNVLRPASRNWNLGHLSQAKIEFNPRAGDPARIAVRRAVGTAHPRALRSAGRPHQRIRDYGPDRGRWVQREAVRAGHDRRAAGAVAVRQAGADARADPGGQDRPRKHLARRAHSL